MNLQEIKEAVLAGKTVHVGNDGYIVVHDSIGQWLIHFTGNQYYIGLTHRDGITMNAKESEFYVPGERRVARINTGCNYNRGQRITIVIEPGQGAYFVDHSRTIEGWMMGEKHTLEDVIRKYLKNEYTCGWPQHWLTFEERLAFDNERDLPDEKFEDWRWDYREMIYRM